MAYRPSCSHNFFMGLDLTSIRSMEIGFSWGRQSVITKDIGYVPFHLGTVEDIRCVLVEDNGLPVEVAGPHQTKHHQHHAHHSHHGLSAPGFTTSCTRQRPVGGLVVVRTRPARQAGRARAGVRTGYLTDVRSEWVEGRWRVWLVGLSQAFALDFVKFLKLR